VFSCAVAATSRPRTGGRLAGVLAHGGVVGPDDFFVLMDMLGAVARAPVPDVAIDRIDRGITLIMESIVPNPRRPFEPAPGD
jgi:hypothetical protein